MLKKLKTLVLGTALTIASINSANAGLIVFTDQTSFESAVDGTLDFEGFNDNSLLNDAITFKGTRGYTGISSLITEGGKALSIREKGTLTINFSHDVFAFSFYVNQLNANTLSYTDSAGNEISNAFSSTDVWDASTFFGVISDTAITSFSLSGTTDSATALYGFDALSFTASPTQVPTPETGLLLLAALIGFAAKRKIKQ